MTERIERVIGRPIPKIRVPVRENSFFKNILSNEQGRITNDPLEIQQWMKEFTETSNLSAVFRAPIQKIIPQIFKSMKIGSTITVPLISSRGTIGLLDMSSNGQFNEEDLTRIRNISHQVTAIILRKQAEDQVKMQLERIRALNDIDHAINSSLDMRVSLEILLKEVLIQLHVDAASILLLNQPGQVLAYVTGIGFRTPAIRQSRLHLGEGLAGQVGHERKILHISDPETARVPMSRTDLFKSEGFVEYIGVPLIAKGTLKGVLEIFHRSHLDPDLDWMNFLETLSGQASIAIDNVLLFEGIQQSNQELIAAYDATIIGWSQAMDLRDKETEGHTQRVTDLTLKLAKRMGIGQPEMVQIRRAALLHDIGKLGVPDQILFKPGPLTDAEWTIMHQHPNFAYNMLMPIAYLRSALDIPYCHHEKWDGSGYPRGLKGEDIPMAARLFAIIDVWDALRSNRPYRASWTAEKTRQYILDQSGKQFDPVVVRYFMEMLEDGEVS
jgi:HD-GYP domain-containing protein (c-di-GMP phosphodiesterase class II)